MRKSVKNRTIYTVLLFICVLGFWFFENFYTPDTYTSPSGQSIQTEMPSFALPSSTTGAIVNHDYYSLSYSETFEQAEWVAYTLEKAHLTYDERKRPYFIEDPKVKSKSADWRNYKRSGYDRGHLCPAGDRRFSEFAYNETFYTSNVSPQNREFNAGVWNKLENKTRQWVKKNGTHFVITGGVLEEGLEEIGDEDVDVPEYYYKIIAKGTAENLKAIAFLMKNRPSSKSVQEFVVTIDEVEKRTGIDFFKELPDKVEDVLESEIQIRNWKF